jgi:hypothetical protein
MAFTGEYGVAEISKSTKMELIQKGPIPYTYELRDMRTGNVIDSFEAASATYAERDGSSRGLLRMGSNVLKLYDTSSQTLICEYDQATSGGIRVFFTDEILIYSDSNLGVTCVDTDDGSVLWRPVEALDEMFIGPGHETVIGVKRVGEIVMMDARTGKELSRSYNEDLRTNSQGNMYLRGSNDGRYLLDYMSRVLIDTSTGETVAVNLASPLPEAEQPRGGELVFFENYIECVRIPPLSESLEEARAVAREYEFTPEERRMYYLE